MKPYEAGLPACSIYTLYEIKVGRIMNNQIILNARSNIKVTNKQKVPLL
jgi:hypothetical protein